MSTYRVPTTRTVHDTYLVDAPDRPAAMSTWHAGTHELTDPGPATVTRAEVCYAVRRRNPLAAWWYTRRARAHARYLRTHVLVPVVEAGEQVAA